MSDYTRGLPTLRPRLWLWPLLASILLAFLLQPLDASLNHSLSTLNLPGDFRRELNTLQQFGQGASFIIVGLVIFLLDPARRHRLLDLALLAAILGAACTLAKGLVGRPRPLLDDPNTFLGPFGLYPLERNGQVFLAHAWDTSKPISSDLWSMPSSHTAFAVAFSVFLVHLYPRLIWLCVPMAALVGFARTVLDAHWPTDVIVGAGLGWAVGLLVIHRSWGVRLIRRLGRMDRPSTTPTPAKRHDTVAHAPLGP